MANDDQAQSDAVDETTVDDPLDASNSQEGTSELDSYESEVDDFLSSDDEAEEPGGEPVESDEEQEDEEESEEEEPGEEAAEESEEEEEAEPEAEEPTQNRFRFNADEDRAVAMLAKAKGISLVEAARLFSGENATEHKENKDEKPTDGGDLEGVEKEIRDLKEERKKGMIALEFENVAEIEEKLEALLEKRGSLLSVKERSENEARREAEAEYHAKFDASAKSAAKFYPDSEKEGSEMWKEMQRLDAQMRELGDPLYHSPDKPMILAKQAGVKLGIPMTKAEAKKADPPKKKPVRPQPAGGSARTTSTEPAKLATEIDSVESMDDYEALLGRAGISMI